MSRSLALAVATALTACATQSQVVETTYASYHVVEAQQLTNRVRVTVDGRLFTEYQWPTNQKYPFFFPVNGPVSDTTVTTFSSNPWPHHRSLWFGLDFVNGGNYWQDSLSRGRIVAQETRIVRAQGREVEFTQTTIWSRPGAPSPFRDARVIRISAPSDSLRIVDFDITLTALMDVHVAKTNHALFSARVIPQLSVDSGGTLVDAAGRTREQGTFGQTAPWADYYGTRASGVTEGIAIFDHPSNRWAPTPWFTRNYGFFSPMPMNWMENGFDVAKDEAIRLRYRVVVHAGTTEQAGIARLYEAYVGGR